MNRKDRHVAAVALAAKAGVVVSNDRRLRRQIDHLDASVRAISGDDPLVGLVDADRDGIEAVIDTMIAKRVRRPVTRGELIGELAGPFPLFADRLDPRRN